MYGFCADWATYKTYMDFLKRWSSPWNANIFGSFLHTLFTCSPISKYGFIVGILGFKTSSMLMLWTFKMAFDVNILLFLGLQTLMATF